MTDHGIVKVNDAEAVNVTSRPAAWEWHTLTNAVDIFYHLPDGTTFGFAQELPLPFPVTVSRSIHTNIALSLDGVIFLLKPGVLPPIGHSSVPLELSMPAIVSQHEFIAPYWSDLMAFPTHAGSSIRIAELAPTNGNRRCVIEYKNLCVTGIGTYADHISFQIILTDNPTNNLITVNYNDVAAVLNGANAAIGIQRPGNQQFDRTSYSFNQPGSVYTGLSLAFALNPGTDPTKIDSDFDGLTDAEELARPVPTDPRQPDTDGDGLTDGWEFDNNMNPNAHNEHDTIANNNADEDFDGDGLTNAHENDLGTSSLPGTGGDTDGDGTSDATEFNSGSDPNNADSSTSGDLVTAEFYFGDHSGSHSEKYCLRLTPVNGIDPRGTISMVNLNYGVCETKTNLLYRGEEYTLTLGHSGTTESGSPDYDYTLEVTVPQPSVIDDPDSIICKNDDGTSFFAQGKQAYIRIGGLDLDIDLDNDGTVNNNISEEQTEADPGAFTAISNRVAIALRSTDFVEWTGTAELVVPTGVEVYDVQTGGSPLISLTFSSSSLPQTLYVMSAEPGEYTLKFVPQGLDSGDEVKLSVVKVESIDVSSARLGTSPNPPPFEGQEEHIFRVDQSPDVDQHAVILYKDAVDDDFNVENFDVTLTAQLAPINMENDQLTFVWEKVSGPISGELLSSSSLSATFRNPAKGGVYRFRLTVQCNGTDVGLGEANLVLPLAGAEMDGVVQADLTKADIFATAVRAKYTRWERMEKEHYMQWFYWNNAGDYVGRPDNENTPSVWYYGQVDTVNQTGENFGLGAVCTWKGTPVRLAKISNFLVGYAAHKIGAVKVFTKAAGFAYGTVNGATGSESWDKGWDLAGDGSYATVAAALVEYIWNHESADDKTRKPWPNSNPPDNNGLSPLFEDFNFDRQYASPGLTGMLTNP